MKKLYLLILISFFALPFQAQNPSLQKLWESQDGLQVPESALYDLVSGKIYVSNIVGNAWDKDGVGFISILSKKGKIETLKWVEELSAPKGLGIYNRHLFVADIDRVNEYDMNTGELLKTYSHEKGLKLNDITVAADGTIYVSDSGYKRIFAISNGEMRLFLESDELERLNGLLMEGDNLLCGVQDLKFLSINTKTKKITELKKGVGYIDGLVQVKPGVYIVSDFKGRVSIIDMQKGIKQLLNTATENINAADLGIIPKENILLVPTFHHNKIVAYQILNP